MGNGKIAMVLEQLSASRAALVMHYAHKAIANQYVSTNDDTCWPKQPTTLANAIRAE